MELDRIDDKPTDPEDEMSGCGYEWDHTVPEGFGECTECGAEIWDDEED